MSSQFDLATFANPPIQPLTISGTDFKDPSNNTMRFWAANVVAFYPDHTTATAFAENLASSGVNMVRWHHLMRPSLDWNTTSQIPALSDYSGNSSRSAPTGKDQTAWDRFDFLTSEFHKNGIYIMLSFDFSRTYLPGDVAIMNTNAADQTAWSNAMQALNGWASAAWNEVMDKWRLLPMIDERCARLQEELITQLLTRNNGYLGQTYGASNQVLAIEILNEASSFYTIVNGNRFEHPSYPALSYFNDALNAKWSAYKSANGVSATADLYSPANETEHAARQAFLNKLDNDHRARIVAKVASLGFSRNVSFSNLWRSESDAKAHSQYGTHDENHCYLPSSIVDPMPYNSHFSNGGGASPDPQEDFVYALAVENAPANKPLIIGELNYPIYASGADRDRRTMMQVAAAGYGVLHGWSAVTWFAWNHGDRHVAATGWGTDERLAPSEDEIGGDMIQDAARLDHFRTCAALFRNGLLSESVSPLTFTVDDPVWNSYGWPPAPKYQFKPGWQAKSRIRKLYGTKPAGQDTSALMTQTPANPITSDTGQIRKDIARKQLTIGAAKAEAFSGLLDGAAPGLLSCLSIGDTSGFATVIAVSSDGADLTSSNRVLLSRNMAIGSTWQGGPSLKLKNLKAPTASSRWYLRPLRPRDLAGVGTATPVAMDANGYIDLPASSGWREAELIYMSDTTTVYQTTQPEVITYTGTGSDLGAAINAAITSGKPLFLAPGTYEVGNIPVGGPFSMYATPGTVTLKMATGSSFILYVGAFGEVNLSGLIFDGANRAFVDDGNIATEALVVAKRDQASNSLLRVTDCTFQNSKGPGLACYAVGLDLTGSRFLSSESAVLSQDGENVRICGNRIDQMASGGISISRSTIGYDGAIITENRIGSIGASDPASTGWQGNGISIYRASHVVVRDNIIRNCAFSGVRANVAPAVSISGNIVTGSGETAIYVESAGETTTMHEATIVGNTVDDAGTGISIANYDKGGRLTVCTGNLLRNVTKKTVAAGQATQYLTSGIGIVVEADAAVTGNVIEQVAAIGVMLGTNGFTRDLLCNDNLIRATPIGIGFSKESGAGKVFIASNMVSGFTNTAAYGAIVPVSYSGSGYARVAGAADLGQQDTSTTWANVRVDRNRCY